MKFDISTSLLLTLAAFSAPSLVDARPATNVAAALNHARGSQHYGARGLNPMDQNSAIRGKVFKRDAIPEVDVAAIDAEADVAKRAATSTKKTTTSAKATSTKAATTTSSKKTTTTSTSSKKSSSTSKAATTTSSLFAGERSRTAASKHVAATASSYGNSGGHMVTWPYTYVPGSSKRDAAAEPAAEGASMPVERRSVEDAIADADAALEKRAATSTKKASATATGLGVNRATASPKAHTAAEAGTFANPKAHMVTIPNSV